MSVTGASFNDSLNLHNGKLYRKGDEKNEIVVFNDINNDGKLDEGERIVLSEKTSLEDIYEMLTKKQKEPKEGAKHLRFMYKGDVYDLVKIEKILSYQKNGTGTSSIKKTSGTERTSSNISLEKGKHYTKAQIVQWLKANPAHPAYKKVLYAYLALVDKFKANELGNSPNSIGVNRERTNQFRKKAKEGLGEKADSKMLFYLKNDLSNDSIQLSAYNHVNDKEKGTFFYHAQVSVRQDKEMYLEHKDIYIYINPKTSKDPYIQKNTLKKDDVRSLISYAEEVYSNKDTPNANTEVRDPDGNPYSASNHVISEASIGFAGIAISQYTNQVDSLDILIANNKDGLPEPSATYALIGSTPSGIRVAKETPPTSKNGKIYFFAMFNYALRNGGFYKTGSELTEKGKNDLRALAKLYSAGLITKKDLEQFLWTSTSYEGAENQKEAKKLGSDFDNKTLSVARAKSSISYMNDCIPEAEKKISFSDEQFNAMGRGEEEHAETYRKTIDTYYEKMRSEPDATKKKQWEGAIDFLKKKYETIHLTKKINKDAFGQKAETAFTEILRNEGITDPEVVKALWEFNVTGMYARAGSLDLNQKNLSQLIAMAECLKKEMPDNPVRLYIAAQIAELAKKVTDKTELRAAVDALEGTPHYDAVQQRLMQLS